MECQLGYIMMLISNGICQYERKYATLNKNICHFWDRNRACFPEYNSKARKHIQIDAMLRSGFFSEDTSVTVPRFGFFQDLWIRVKCTCVLHGANSRFLASIFFYNPSNLFDGSFSWLTPVHGHHLFLYVF